MQQPYAHFKQTPHTGFPNTPPHRYVFTGQSFTCLSGGAFKMTMVFSYTDQVRNISIADKAKKDDIRYYIFDVLMYFTFSSFDSNPVFHIHKHTVSDQYIKVCLGCQNADLKYWGPIKQRKKTFTKCLAAPHDLSRDRLGK